MLPSAFAAAVSQATSASSMMRAVASYKAFRNMYRSQAKDSGGSDDDFGTRFQLFMVRKAEITAHNADPHSTWIAETNKFTDFTDGERSAMLGFRRVSTSGWGPRRPTSLRGNVRGGHSLLQLGPIFGGKGHGRHRWGAKQAVDWRHLNTSRYLREQGSCGSCWAVAAAGALEMHAEIAKGHARKLSFSQLVDCTPNPRHCGGTGGCDGATAELAFEYVQDHGLADEEDYPSTEVSGTCSSPDRVSTTTTGFRRLPENRYNPLLYAVGQDGPIVVSVDAGRWFSYRRGVFNSCPRDCTVNHAVLLVGYGHDEGFKKTFWLIRNSWGEPWGEDGFMRLERHESDTGEAGYCGTDREPLQGVGCEGGPKEIPVCGMCGILSDSSYPLGVKVHQ